MDKSHTPPPLWLYWRCQAWGPPTPDGTLATPAPLIFQAETCVTVNNAVRKMENARADLLTQAEAFWVNSRTGPLWEWGIMREVKELRQKKQREAIKGD